MDESSIVAETAGDALAKWEAQLTGRSGDRVDAGSTARDRGAQGRRCPAPTWPVPPRAKALPVSHPQSRDSRRRSWP